MSASPVGIMRRKKIFRGDDNDFTCVCVAVEVGVEQPGGTVELSNKEEIQL